MSRIAIPTVNRAPAASAPMLQAVNKQLGMVPNLMKLLSNSPAALEGYLSLNAALGKGVLDLPTRERIALAIAQQNGCDYCLSAHTYIGTHLAKLEATEISAARGGRSADSKADAAVRFAVRVAQTRGQLSDADLAAVRAAGFADDAVVEMVLNVALNVLTNYVNLAADTDIDFPVVTARAA